MPYTHAYTHSIDAYCWQGLPLSLCHDDCIIINNFVVIIIIIMTWQVLHSQIAQEGNKIMCCTHTIQLAQVPTTLSDMNGGAHH